LNLEQSQIQNPKSKIEMICQNCQSEVDNDLVFCTDCGARLHETVSGTPTVLMKDSVVTQVSAPPPKSNLKWVALIVALLAIPASIFGVYLLLNRQPKVAQNVNKSATPAPSPTRKANTNQANKTNVNSNVNSANTNLNANQTDENVNAATPQPAETVIWKERIEISPDSHYSVSFEMPEDGNIVGTVKAVEGSPIEGYVYTQQQYDEKFPDHTFKMFSFSGEKKAETKQRLLKENYVLIFVNKGESSIMIEGSFSIEK